MLDEFWSERPLLFIPVKQCAYGRHCLGEPAYRPEPIRVEWLPDHNLYLVHDGRHRIEWVKTHGGNEILAHVLYIST